MYYRGKFTPRNPQKYEGDPTNIIYRSSWELRVMKYFDRNENVLKWSSEETIVGYKSPLDGQIHRYFVDFKFTVKDRQGNIITYLAEVKPKAQTKQPIPQKRKTKKYINEVHTWGVNQAKWEAARAYCKKRGWKFELITEDDLGL